LPRGECSAATGSSLRVGRVKGQVLEPLHGRDEAGKNGLEAIAADAIRRLPQVDECFANRLSVDPSTVDGWQWSNEVNSR